MRLYGLELDEPDVRGVPFAEEVLFAVFHASDTPTTFVLPSCSPDAHWEVLLDTAAGPETAVLAPPPYSALASPGIASPPRDRTHGVYQSMSAYPLQGRSVVLLRQERQTAPAPGRAVTVAAAPGRARPRRRSSDYRSR
jgi:hypothetical protein